MKKADPKRFSGDALFLLKIVRYSFFSLRSHQKFTEVIEIQGEKPPKPVARSPTAQTPCPNLFIFWREPPHVNAFRGTVAILNFILGAEI